MLSLLSNLQGPLRLTQSDRIKMLSDEGVHTLLLLEVTPDDQSAYHCEAKSKLGNATCTAKLKVEGKEKAISWNKTTIRNKGQGTY